MKYSASDLPMLEERYEDALRSLGELQIAFVALSQRETDPDVIEHLAQGVGMRLMVLSRAIENTFTTLDLNSSTPLSNEKNNDLQIYLHAFLINVVGLFDNCAWAFCYKHGITELLQKPLEIDFFKKSFKSHLPTPLKEHLEEQRLSDWHKTYLKSYRDALAHRIPPRVPPLTVDSNYAKEYEDLERDRWNRIHNLDFEGAEHFRNVQRKYESPAFFFLHSFKESSKSTPLMLHAQMIADVFTIREFLDLFQRNWAGYA